MNAAAGAQVSEGFRIDSGAGAEVIEPRMVAIPEGWFVMGSDTGQDNERPVHRVWVDAFEMAECQVAGGRGRDEEHSEAPARPGEELPVPARPSHRHAQQRNTCTK